LEGAAIQDHLKIISFWLLCGMNVPQSSQKEDFCYRQIDSGQIGEMHYHVPP
jgi:hypothetical protein